MGTRSVYGTKGGRRSRERGCARGIPNRGDWLSEWPTSATTLTQFLKNRWIQCAYCLADNLTDIAVIPAGNEPQCASCSRQLI
jgi:hypothetical protein